MTDRQTAKVGHFDRQTETGRKRGRQLEENETRREGGGGGGSTE